MAGSSAFSAILIQPFPDPWAVLDTLTTFLQNVIKYSLFILATLSTFIGGITTVVAALTALIIATRRLLEASRGKYFNKY
jgi:hypothetical protein